MPQLDARISFPAAMLADPARETIVMALMDGRAYTAKELAFRARITPQTASHHLRKLVETLLLVRHRQGRHAYYRLNGADVAAAIEALVRISPSPSLPAHAKHRAAPFRHARRCYDHLAGVCGVAIAARIEALDLVVSAGADYRLTAKGGQFFAEMGLDVEALRAKRRHFLRPCIDWTERQPHIAGAIGAALLDHYLAQNWFESRPASRQLTLTRRGARMLGETFGVAPEALVPRA